MAWKQLQQLLDRNPNREQAVKPCPKRAFGRHDRHDAPPALLGRTAAASPGTAHQSLNQTAMKKKAVLLADADPRSGRKLAGFLSDRGVPTLLAAGSAEVLALLRSQSIGLAVLDTNLEGRDGWGLRTRVADLKPLLPIVMMTAAIGQLARATEAGVDALVEKPVDPDTMLRIVRELLAQSTESRLRQVFVTGIVRRYVPQTGDHFLDALRLRSTTPLATPELDEVLARCVPSWQTIAEAGATTLADSSSLVPSPGSSPS